MLQTVKQINTEQFVVQLQIFTKFLPKLSFCPELYQTVTLCFITCDNVMTHISHRMIQLMRQKVSTHTHSRYPPSALLVIQLYKEHKI